MCVERQGHEERGGQHHEDYHAERGGVATAEHVQGHLQGVGKEQNRRANHKPFPTESDDPKGHTCKDGVGHSGLPLCSHIVEGSNERERVG